MLWLELVWSLGVLESNICNYSINQDTLSELVRSILELLDVHANVICRVTLVLDIQTRFMNLTDSGFELLVVLAKKDAVVNIYHEDNVSTIENTVVNYGSGVAQ